MPKIEMSFEESQKFLKGAREGKNVSPPRTEYTPGEAGQLLKEANTARVPKGTKKSSEIVPTASAETEGRERGGPVKKGKKYVVGEKGPEVFVPKKSGVIIPNRTTPKPQKKETRGLAAFVKEMKQEN